MKIDKEDLYYGAAVLQVAEHKSFKAINRLPAPGLPHTYLINTDVGLHLKYASAPVKGSYRFSFSAGHMEALEKLWSKMTNLLVGLVCARAGQVACVRYLDLMLLHHKHQSKEKTPHSVFPVRVSVPRGRQLRLWVPYPNRRTWGPLSEPLLIPRDHFPWRVFRG
jgi:hypothetical protein